MIRVLLVDDQKSVREALKISLKPETDIEVVGTADNGITAIKQVETLQPDIVIMNVEMPGMDGANATRQIVERFPNTKVLIFTSYDSDEYITKSFAMGAKGYLLKSLETKELAGAIRNIYKGYTQIAPGLLEKLLVYTDSGVVLSKLKAPVYSSRQNIGSRHLAKSQKTISGLQVAVRQQQEEIAQLRRSLDISKQELPRIRKNLSTHSRHIKLISLLWLVSLPLLGVFLLRLYAQANDLQLSVIPTERIGLYGEFNLSGIAQRVAKEFEADPILSDVSSVYVAQEGDAIVLKGTIADSALLERMTNIAMEVTGVNKVYTSQVAVQTEFRGDISGVAEPRFTPVCNEQACYDRW
ncbi:response regulator [Pleurocapsales cyanobacterium LEGE 10410]|nr:response regulator [Pleurocapsales cyanobacterium LEGE 10410]